MKIVISMLLFACTGNAFAGTSLDCTASVSEYVSLQDGISSWHTVEKKFSIQSVIGQHVVSTVSLNGYSISAVILEQEALVPAVAAQLSLSIVRKDANGVYKFHTNSQTALPLMADGSFKLVGWDMSGKHEKFDIGISLRCQ